MVIFLRDVNCYSCLKIDNIVFECFYLFFGVLQALQEFKCLLIRLIAFLLYFEHVVRGSEHLFLQRFLIFQRERILLLKVGVLVGKCCYVHLLLVDALLERVLLFLQFALDF